VNQQPWRKYCIQPPCGQLNPTNPNLYRVLRDLYRDILDVFPLGEAFHMGGDEVQSFIFFCGRRLCRVYKLIGEYNAAK
jgi:hexosaminidase